MTKFTELKRITVSPTTDICISKVEEDGTLKGWNINNYVRTEKYIGFTKGGVFVPEGSIEEFGVMVKECLANG